MADTLPYLNASLPIDERLDDLLRRMTLEEKVGQLFHTRIAIGPSGALDPGDKTTGRTGTEEIIGQKHMTFFNLTGEVSNIREAAEWHNRVQRFALNNTRLGIPVTLSTDPRHAFTLNLGTGALAGGFSQWPETLGLAALRDPKWMRKFAEAVREEYMAIGIRCALHPQVDLVTEYRWARNCNTMGEDAELAAELVVEYVKGLQGDKLGHHSVTAVTKHFPGGGPEEDGEDSHFVYGQNQVYPGDNFDYHLIPFKAAIAAGTAQMMPYYSKPVGTKYEEVAFGYNKGIITDLLRNELGFDGIVLSDWTLISDTIMRPSEWFTDPNRGFDDKEAGQLLPARAWGCEHLSPVERVAKVLDAGTDQFGGEECPQLVIEAIQSGLVSEKRVDTSVRRLLREKFVLGLFDNPFVDVDAAEKIVGRPELMRLGAEAQRAALTLLTNKDEILPLGSKYKRVYVEGFDAALVESYGLQVVESPSEADIALLRLLSPWEPRPGAFEAAYHAGSLEYNAEEQARQATIYQAVPTVVDLYLDRPAAIPELVDGAAAILGNFGASPEAVLDVVLCKNGARPQGKLPFDLPRSTAAVAASREDVPFDTENPVLRFGHGLSYAN